jgi:hypothetical protein
MKVIFLVFILFCSRTSVFLQEKQNRNPSKSPQTNETAKAETQQNEVVVPDASNADWEKYFFKEIDKRTKKAKLKRLRETEIAEDDIEIRLWLKPPFNIKLEGMILKRTKNVWSAVYLDSKYVSKRFIYPIIKYSEPKSGWEKTWQKLLNAEILTLPDAESIKCNHLVPDAETYIVELKKGDNYRTYKYDAPGSLSLKNCRADDQIVEIYKTIFQEFGID